MKKLGFIGAGNMASALISGIVEAKLCAQTDILASDPDKNKLCELNKMCGISTTQDNNEIIVNCETVVLAVKPQVAPKVLRALKFSDSKPLIISIMAGVTTDTLAGMLIDGIRIIRVMPNTPALIKKGVTAICSGKSATTADIKFAESVFGCVGSTLTVEEKYINAISAISGSGPAYFYLIIEALSDAGVSAGLPRDMALKLATETAIGSSQMILDTGKHPAMLKDAVTSPAGTTIAAVSVLENYSIRAAFISAVQAATQRAEEMG